MLTPNKAETVLVKLYNYSIKFIKYIYLWLVKSATKHQCLFTSLNVNVKTDNLNKFFVGFYFTRILRKFDYENY